MRKNKIHILYQAVMDRGGNHITVGGIQNYLIALSLILKKNGHEVVIFQGAESGFKTSYKGIEIIGVKNNLNQSMPAQMKQVYKSVKENIYRDDIIIFGTDKAAFKIKEQNQTIAIQHGISFDYISYEKLNPILKKNLFGSIYKLLQCYRNAKSFLQSKHTVCVDYNFLNWIRTILPRKYSETTVVIPNFAKPSDLLSINFQDSEKIKVLFARRFEPMRGVDILIEVVKKVSSKYSNVEFTICGDGPLKNRIENEIGSMGNVHITKFDIGESEKMNINHHITMVPTYGSEGTSFSLLEGMACGTIPLVSNVGGMTNIILNNYNGLMSNPNPNDIADNLSKLIESNELRLKLSKNASDTLKSSFSLENWEQMWLTYIDTVKANKN